jgi:hypothetical protein
MLAQTQPLVEIVINWSNAVKQGLDGVRGKIGHGKVEIQFMTSIIP